MAAAKPAAFEDVGEELALPVGAPADPAVYPEPVPELWPETELELEEEDELELEPLEELDLELPEPLDFDLLPDELLDPDELLEPDEWLVLFPTPEWAAEEKTKEIIVKRANIVSSLFLSLNMGYPP